MMPGATSASSLISLPKLPEGCKERLQKVLSCTVAGLVNGLGTSNVEQYLELLQELSIISHEDLDLREKVREAVKNGPQLHVSCKRARLPGISKREKVKVEVFVQGRKEKHLETEVVIGDTSESEKKEVTFDLDGDLPLPRSGVESCLRVELS